jgi:hypothetical protein
MGIMCLSGATCLPADSCFHELALKKIQLSMLFQYNLSPMITWLYAVNYNHCRLLDFYVAPLKHIIPILIQPFLKFAPTPEYCILHREGANITNV